MARVPGVPSEKAGWFVRFVYWSVRRRFGWVMEPLRITAHHPRLLRAVGHMELGQEAARTVDERLKCLASVKAAMMIGCPF